MGWKEDLEELGLPFEQWGISFDKIPKLGKAHLMLILNAMMQGLDEGGGSLEVMDEGVSLGFYKIMNFVGADVMAQDPALPDQVNVYIPPPAFVSHWNTADGSNGNQAVSESLSRITTRISTPNGGEGSPFKTGGWAGSNRDTVNNSVVTFTTPGNTTGFGGDCTMAVEIYDADGVTLLDSFSTGITGNGTFFHGGYAQIVTSGYGPDSMRFQANVSIQIDMSVLLPAGGRYHVVATHTTDSATDGTGPYTYTQSDVFYDTDPTTPAINSTVGLVETGGSILTKHLSGIEYYILGSEFTVDVNDIDQLNRNTIRVSDNLRLEGSELGLPQLQHSPFGTGAANFIGWNNDNDTDDVDYLYTAWAITSNNFRYIGPSGNIYSFPRDPWANGGNVNSPDQDILIDTYGVTSGDLVENFDDENRRQDSGFNGGSWAGNWNSVNALLAGEAIVFGGTLRVPNQTNYIRSDGPNSPNANWIGYKPDLGGANPDYSALGAPASYYRTWRDVTGLSRSSGTLVFTGTFAGGNALADLVSGGLQVRFWKVAGIGNVGPPPGNPFELFLDGGPYNFGTFDDGVTDGQIREATSSGNTINFTFGGFNMQDGVYMEITIVDPAIRIDGITAVFF